MNSRKKILLLLAATLVAVVAVVWISISVGRYVERVRVHNYLNLIQQEVDRNRASMQSLSKDLSFVEGMSPANDKMLQTISALRNLYVDPIELDTIYEKAIPALLAELDPHSAYIPARNFEAVNESLEGEFDGIGVVFNASTDTVTVLSVIPQGPSDKAGVRPGDRIVRIDGRNVAGQKIPQDSLVRMMRGKRGSKVKLSLKRIGLNRDVEVVVVRDAIELHSIETAFMLDREEGIGFVRLSQFARTSYSELREALMKLAKQGMTSLILDLRGNSGGFLDQAILIANEFLGDDKLIVYTEDREGDQQRQYSNGRGGATDLGLAILVDETSASSSEILAGAIQDNDRGLVIGRRTFGKGLVQSQIPFADGSAIRLTVARYYTPTGRSIQKPYVNGDEMAYHMDIINRFNNNEFFSADSIHFNDSLKFTTPGGRTVYGGGGIMPDIFVPLDTVGVSKYYNEVWNSNVLYRYTMDFTDRHRAQMDTITCVEGLDALFATKNLLDDFTRYAERNGVKTDPQGLAKSRDIILAQIRAYIGRNAMSDDAGFYYNIYAIDKVLQRAVEELKTEKK